MGLLAVQEVGIISGESGSRGNFLGGRNECGSRGNLNYGIFWTMADDGKVGLLVSGIG